MPRPTTDLPRATEDIAAWLGGEDIAQIEEVRFWHGDAALVVALEYARPFAVHARGRAFFDRIKEIQQRRKWAGDWPSVKMRAWVAAEPPEPGEPSPADAQAPGRETE